MWCCAVWCGVLCGVVLYCGMLHDTVLFCELDSRSTLVFSVCCMVWCGVVLWHVTLHHVVL